MAKGIYAYIDCSNIMKSVNEMGFRNIDWPGLINWLKTKQKVTRVYLYAGYGDVNEKKALLALEKHGYIVNLKKVQQYPPETTQHRLKCPCCHSTHLHAIKHFGKRKANCDAELTLDAINDGVRKKYDGVIIFSGDGDFAHVYEYISEQLGKPVTVIAPMGFKVGYRTSAKVKLMYKKGIIKINALEGIFGFKGYGIK